MRTDRPAGGAVPERMQLRPISTRSRAWLIGLTAVLPMVVCSVAVGMMFGGDRPAPLNAGSLLLLAAIVMCGIFCAYLLRSFRRHHISLDTAGIEVATTFYRRRLAFPDLDLAAARVVDLAEHTELRPMLKTNAVDVPGFKSGWYRLRNWQSALVAVSDGPRVLWLPTRLKYGLLLQPLQPQELLDRLRELAGTGRRH